MCKALQSSGVVQRAVVLGAIFTLALGGLGQRLYRMQLVDHTQFSRAALAQRFHSVRKEAPRGAILDRNGQTLVTNRPARRLFLLYPYYLTEDGAPSPLLGSLAALTGVRLTDLEARVEEKLRGRRFFEPLLIKEDLSPAEVTRLVELQGSLPGAYLDTYPQRDYPHGDLAAHLLGHLGPVDLNELARLEGEGYLAGDQIGKMGVELQYDQWLRGTSGLVDLEVDATFRPTSRSVERTQTKPGASLRSTLDLHVQKTVQTALARTLAYVSTHPDWEGVMFPKTNAGAAVVMDVRTGAILAMASYPTFDPALFAGPRSEAATAGIRRLESNRYFPLYNRAIQGEYLPGSTWKMLTAAAALEHGVVRRNETVFCGGVYDKIEPKKDWKAGGHGRVDVVGALANSCNIYFYEMGYRLGIDALAQAASRFGFGNPLGIDLPGEMSGWIPDQTRRSSDSDPSSWAGGKLLSAAIGQGPTATPLQLARYAAVIANGGIKVRPHVISAAVDASGQVIQDLTPPPDGRVEVSAATLQAIVDGMKAVTEWGTSASAFAGLPVKVAGKTGTAEAVGKANCDGDATCQYGIYVAFAPADRPEIAIAVVGERAGHGDSMNPVVRAAVAAYFKAALAKDDPLYAMGILPPSP